MYMTEEKVSKQRNIETKKEMVALQGRPGYPENLLTVKALF